MTDLFQNVSDYLHAGKEAIDLFKTAYTLLPKGEKRDEIERKVNLASEAMKRSDAALAQKLGYNLCQCEFPPSIMLWREKQSAYVCQNPECNKSQVVKPFNRDLSQSSGEYF
jgi:hypothetical protein